MKIVNLSIKNPCGLFYWITKMVSSPSDYRSGLSPPHDVAATLLSFGSNHLIFAFIYDGLP